MSIMIPGHKNTLVIDVVTESVVMEKIGCKNRRIHFETQVLTGDKK